jgi:peptide/nickel transport system substrate-binding protein
LRRLRLRSIAILLSALGLVTTAFGVVTTVSASAAPKHGGTFNIEDLGLSWATLDPSATAANASAAWPIFSPMYEGLFTTTPSGTIEDQLATGFSFNPSRSSLTIDLRKGVKFQDGTPFNSSAVIFNLQRETVASSGSSCVTYFTSVSSMTTDGTYKAKINFSTPNGAIINELAGQSCFVMASPMAVTSEGSAYGTRPVGTGPYKFVSEEIGSSIDYTKWTG